jgi:hypothetical protein
VLKEGRGVEREVPPLRGLIENEKVVERKEAERRRARLDSVSWMEGERCYHERKGKPAAAVWCGSREEGELEEELRSW